MMRDAGFEATALWWEEDDARLRGLRDKAVEMVRTAGLLLDNIHVPYRRCACLWGRDNAERLEVVERHLRWVEDCARHEVPGLVMHVSGSVRTELDLDQGLDSLRRVVERAEDRGVTVALENTRSTAPLDWLFMNIDSPALTLCYDSSHDQLYGEAMGALLNRWGDRLAVVHLSDTDGRLDRHWLPGEGVIDFGALFATPALAAFRGACLLEVVPRERDATALEFLVGARERLETVLGRSTAARESA